MKIAAQVFISITGTIKVHALGIATDGIHPDWLAQYERCLGVEQLEPLVAELERRKFVKQPSTGYLLIYALMTDDAALPAAQD